MKELLLQYARYNVWANKRIIDAILNQEPAAVDREIVSSFPTIRATVYHTWSAESIWLDRLNGVEKPIWQQGTFTGTFEQACKNWEQASASLVDFIKKQDETIMTRSVSFTYRSGESAATPAAQILHHVFNHSTYHRGQLVTMLRQAGATEIPGTDFIGFVKVEN